MKKIILTLLIIHCSLIIGKCQWITQSLPFNGVVYGIAFRDINNGVACGHTFGFSEMMYYTTNSGTGWILASYPASIRALTTVQYINPTTLYAGGAENITKYILNKEYSNDFEKLPSGIKNWYIQMGINGLSATYKGAFIKSTNSGLNWIKVYNFDTSSGYLLDIHFLNENTGYASADSGSIGNSRILKTSNGGIDWQKYYLESGIYLGNIFFIDVNTGFTCGFSPSTGGLIFKTTNGGINWSKKTFPMASVSEIKDICFLNSTTGIVIGQGGVSNPLLKIFRSTNTGTTWDSVTSFGNILPEYINYLNGTGTAVITGYFDSSGTYLNYVIKTTDYGNTWVRKKVNVTNKLIIKSSLVDQSNWFIGGGDVSSSAVVLKSTNSGGTFIKQISNIIPDRFYLHQNYPNPFNPVTKIKFEIPPFYPPLGKGGNGGVSLKIFDILGKEIQELVNEPLSPGTYEVTFDGSNLPSGIYFYQLQCGDFVETKKLVLLK